MRHELMPTINRNLDTFIQNRIINRSQIGHQELFFEGTNPSKKLIVILFKRPILEPQQDLIQRVAIFTGDDSQRDILGTRRYGCSGSNVLIVKVNCELIGFPSFAHHPAACVNIRRIVSAVILARQDHTVCSIRDLDSCPPDQVVTQAVGIKPVLRYRNRPSEYHHRESTIFNPTLHNQTGLFIDNILIIKT